MDLGIINGPWQMSIIFQTMISTRAANRLSCLNPSGSVFAEYTALSNKHKSVNLGQGFPALPVAQFIKDAAKLAVENPGPFHQYTRSEGHPRLVNALSRFYEPLIKRSLDPMTEIVTTDGANEAIYSTMQAFINPGDEVILMEPFFDSYKASVELAGGVCVSVSMSQTGQRASDWKLNLVDLENSISSKTKMLILNNPHNPIGKVFTDKELGQLAQFAIRHDLLVLADEVYETLVFSDSTSPMIKFASLPGMYERTITVGSIGKMFGVTGWRTGFAIAPKELIRSIWMVHQYIPFSVTTPMQVCHFDVGSCSLVSGTGPKQRIFS
jgi:aspartate/methionine/tyrosine aminotransferase